MDIKDTAAAWEFRRALVFSFTVRQNYGPNVWPAFQEFISEPDINGHWETLGKEAVASMIGSAVHLVHEAQKRGGGNLDTLPHQIRESEEYAPLVDAARTLIHSLNDGPAVMDAECARLVADTDTPDAVALFAVLVMTVLPAPDGGDEE